MRAWVESELPTASVFPSRSFNDLMPRSLRTTTFAQKSRSLSRIPSESEALQVRCLTRT
jgi:hypothetical protein